MRVFIILSILFCSVDSLAQYDWNSEHWGKESLGFGCSFSAEMTVPVSKMTRLLAEKRIKEIRETLNSKLAADQYLATFLLERLSKKGELKITDNEQKRIQEIRSSNEMVPFCSGCTLWTELPLKELFEDKKHEIVSLSADYWFDTYYKIYYKNKGKRG